ncbi:hypothetical protein [Pedococcus bigeumensis]|uniref:Integral membrane protein n=1 Tax=Pedococcus bigeumensis TaxID=433644 RepID=A0A502CW59_9MICO|nr:hypothetical protein [Pedococcus bigeumensis]TPG17835.1 hypothetical protein EAH86_05200 [Pedococcus bigeumensis]
MTFALLAALVGTLGYGVASVLQAVGTARANGMAVLKQPTYLAGLGCDATAWVASLVALRQLPLFAVQALLAGSLAVTVVVASVVLKTRLRVRDVVAVGAITVALVVLAASAGPPSAVKPPSAFTPVMMFVLAILVVVAVATWRRPRSVSFALVAGGAFSGAALCARAAHKAGGWGALLHEPLAWGVLGYGAIGMVCYTLALDHGPVGPATAILWVVEVAVPAAVGVAVLGDSVRTGWGVPAAVSLVVALAACVALARQDPGGPYGHPPPAT